MQNGEFEFHYKNTTLPPPFANQLTITALKKSEKVEIEFEQEYLYRDDISIDEVIQEGFPIEEKYQWKGDLPLTWFDASNHLFKKTTLTKDEKKITEKEPKIWIKYQDDQGAFSEGMPGDTGSWEYFLQEFIQAVYEMGKMEKPLTIRLMLNKTSITRTITLTPSFVNRVLNVWINEDGKEFSKTVKWQLFRICAKHVYALDYLSEKSAKEEPTKNGIFIDPGDGLWYEAGVSVKEPGKGTKNIEKIEELIETL